MNPKQNENEEKKEEKWRRRRKYNENLLIIHIKSLTKKCKEE